MLVDLRVRTLGAQTSFGDTDGAAALRDVVNWAAQYALIALVLGGITGMGAWVWGAFSARPEQVALGQRVLLVTCGASLALGSIAPILNMLAATAGS